VSLRTATSGASNPFAEHWPTAQVCGGPGAFADVCETCLPAGTARHHAGEMPENRFVGEVARTYDETVAHMFAPEKIGPTVECLESLAEGGRVLEFALGTGRVALPLAARGVDVSGIELSADMLVEFRRAVGADAVHAAQGDMATTRVGGEFSLVYLVFNTITNLTTQDEQVACFENAARHLAPGGRFVIENGVPALRRLPPGAVGVPFTITEDYIGLDDFVDRTHLQISRSRHFRRTADGTFDEFTAPFRYVWPSELDLMARIAGMTLEHRWAGWDRSLFTGDSPSHVSVWRRSAS
jgi:SAM-dependent methyltransferase